MTDLSIVGPALRVQPLSTAPWWLGYHVLLLTVFLFPAVWIGDSPSDEEAS